MKKSSLFILLVLFAVNANSQNLSIKYSDALENVYKVKYLGTSSQLAFAYVRSDANDFIVSFDKATMKEKNRTITSNKDKKAKDSLKLFGLWNSIIVNDNRVKVYLRGFEEKNRKKEIYTYYIKTFDKNLNCIGTKKVTNDDSIYISSKHKFSKELRINASEGKILNSEFETDQGDNIYLQYKLLDSNLNLLASNNIKLSLIVTKSNSNDNVKDLLDQMVKDKNNHKINSDDVLTLISDNVYSKINLINGSIVSIPIEFPQKKIKGFKTVETDNKVSVYGLFKDEKEDRFGYFIWEFDSKTLSKLSEPKFYFFKQEQLKFSNKIHDLMLEGLNTTKEGVIFIISEFENTTIQKQIDNSKYHTIPYCYKGDIAMVKINNSGNIDWINSFVRHMEYPEWTVKDIHLLAQDNLTFVLFKEQYNDRAQPYTLLDNTTGKFEKHFCAYDADNSDNKAKLGGDIKDENFVLIGNEIYFHTTSYQSWGGKSFTNFCNLSIGK